MHEHLRALRQLLTPFMITVGGMNVPSVSLYIIMNTLSPLSLKLIRGHLSFILLPLFLVCCLIVIQFL